MVRGTAACSARPSPARGPAPGAVVVVPAFTITAAVPVAHQTSCAAACFLLRSTLGTRDSGAGAAGSYGHFDRPSRFPTRAPARQRVPSTPGARPKRINCASWGGSNSMLTVGAESAHSTPPATRSKRTWLIALVVVLLI